MNKKMNDNQMIAYFSIDLDSEHYKAWGERHVVKGTVGSTLASATGGYVKSSGRLNLSDKYFVLFGVSQASAKLFGTAPEVFMETVFSEDSQKKFGILNLTIRLV